MNNIQYIGEHLIPGKLGHFFAILAFVASLVAVIAYFSATTKKELTLKESWRKIGRWAFSVQIIAVFGVFATLCWILFHHYYEYSYAWQYTNRETPAHFLFAAIWHGQEGSFLLWSLWNSILGFILMRTAREWEAPTMTIMSFVQFSIASMMLGLYFFGIKIGSDPFILFRESNPAMPVFANANYMNFITDGRGLNPLLQNYWMTIHPPVLFCGFASTAIPFAYAVAGLWTKKFDGWTRAALPWASFSAMILGVGIMMGGVWAYETLSFGGFWAWDPVENAALVPWLIMVAGIHTLLIFNHTKRALRATYLFFILSFILILYATYMTRSGVLGETSVHAFTGLGMSGQLLIFLFVFLIVAFTLFIIHYNKIPTIQKEEALNSREFWMFLGSLVFLLGAIFIMFSTSIPVWNKLFGTKLAPPSDNYFHYNKVMVFIAILIAVGSGAVQHLRYMKSDGKRTWKALRKPLIITLVLGSLIVFWGNMNYIKHGIGFLIALDILVYSSVFAIFSNGSYIHDALRGKMQKAGPSIAHIGFALMLLGIVISMSKQKAISHDELGLIGNDYFPAGTEEAKTPEENVYLPRNIKMDMQNFEVTYLGDSTSSSDPKTYYKVHYKEKDKKGDVVRTFTLYPDAFVNPDGEEGLIANPDKRHYLTHDVFTYVTSVFDPSKMSDTTQYEEHQVQEGDSVFFSTGYFIVEDIVSNPSSPNYKAEPGDLAVGAKLKVFGEQGQTYDAMPIYYLRDSSYQYNVPDTVDNQALYIRFEKILPNEKKIQLAVKQSGIVNDYIVMKAYVFPFVNVVWLGTILMAIGFIISIRDANIKLKRRRSIKEV